MSQASLSQSLDMSFITALTISTILFLFLVMKWTYSNRGSKKNLPPSLPGLPIIGNLHQLGKYAHRSLESLARSYGRDVMMVRFGFVPVMIVSSSGAAREIMRTHDAIFASRPDLSPANELLYGKKAVSMSPAGEYWRQARSLCVSNLLGQKRVKAMAPIRREETDAMLADFRRSSELSMPVDLSAWFASVATSVISRVNFGRDERGSRALTAEFSRLIGGFNIGHYIPFLSWIGRVNGYNTQVDRVTKELDEFLEGIVVEHERRRSFGGKVKGEDEKDLVDVLLDVQDNARRDGSFMLDRDGVKALIMDMYSGATDSTYTVLEWAMSELLRNPKILKKLQAEIDKVTAGKEDISESDIEKMPYLKSVVKETCRLYPPSPLIVPRESLQDCKVKGYDVPAKTRVIVSAWAIGRDPEMWTDPERFDPDRFLPSVINDHTTSPAVEFKVNDNFQMVPFGAGRRGCPGVSFAAILLEFVLANVVHKFDWAFPDGISAESLDMNECVGFTIHRDVHLRAMATPRF